MHTSVRALLTSAFFLLFFMASTSFAQKMVIATYNIRYDNPRDTGNLWADRIQPVASLIEFHRFDVFGVQEALKHQLDDLRKALPAFDSYGKGRDDGHDQGEHSAIFFKRSKFDLVDKGDFWLSPTPDKPGPGWDANINRICSWVKLRDKKSGKTFHVFNAHYDHQGVKARIESSKLVLTQIRVIAADGPVVFMGDLNGGRDSEWYLQLSASGRLKDSHTLSKVPYQPNGSFNGFNSARIGKEVIDHIFITHHFKTGRWAVLTDTYYGKFPSDHFPVLTDLTLK